MKYFLKDFGKRLKEMRTDAGLSADQFAKKIFILRTSLYNYENGGRFPSPEVLDRIAKLFKMKYDISWLLTGEGEMFARARQTSDSSNFQLVPVIGAAACGSSGRIAEGDIEGYKAFEIAFVRKFKNPVLTRAKGESMLPVIADGDLLLCDRDVNKRMRPDPRHMYLVNHPDEANEVAIKVKKISFSGKTLTLIPLNPAYSPLAVDVTGKSILDVVLGQIVWIGRELI